MTTTRVSPNLVSEELIKLTRELGAPDLDLAILAEGNTSELVSDTEIVVKASGAAMSDATQEDFVVCEYGPLVEMMDDSTATQSDLTNHLIAEGPDGKSVRGSIETLIHAAVRSVSPLRFVAHTHPTAAVALLSSRHAERAFEHFVYSDEAVVIGRPLYVPYAQPGIDLGRLFMEKFRDFVKLHGTVPSLVLLANHGLVAISDTAKGARAVSLMANKGAMIRLSAYAAGGVSPISDESVAKYFARDDIVERRQNLSGV